MKNPLTEFEAEGGKKRVSNILLKVENAGAEKLWSYILAYRRMISKVPQGVNDESSQNNITLGVLPTLEQAKPVGKPKRNMERRFSA